MNERQQAAVAELVDGLDAPESVREIAHALAHRAFAAEMQMGRSIEMIAASAVYAAFRRDGESHTLDEVSAEADVDRTKLGRTYRCLANRLNIKLEPADPHEFVGRFADSLNIEDRTEAYAHEIVTMSVEAGLHTGIKPAGAAAAAVYLADNDRHDHLTQPEIAAIADVSVVTIQNRLYEQTRLLGDDEHGQIPASRWQYLETD
ncbi:transcription initiation factor IIB family protein [Halococcus thailandensis]|uniref:Transcription factor TFIIB cyclin-related protein n=1 Tax=Halococcus thailandensis JCM 13552 TaxID=1227457 RepID=M0NDJ4_9EURY|nr:transcription initiation factor IIB family protein [Halococcus thailandensis]EMA56027.1 transcription factor TFIIB cyclin-related protein [Halococcus thailandensis JCM 13552]